MLRISSKLSVLLSLALCVLIFVLCIFGAAVMPDFTDLLIKAGVLSAKVGITSGERTIILILAYSALADIIAADAVMFSLLIKIRKGLVFTPQSVSHIRGISWCCILLCLIFCGLGIYFKLAFIIAFAALFLGLCLRVVKNVIEEAAEIKSENDLTV